MELYLTLFSIAVLIFSAVFHEYMHGWTANQLGDATAKYAGRLTLDPRKHIDLFGTILLPIFLYLISGFVFGYAKPVPYNPYNLKYHKWGPAIVGVAGPLSNLFLALVFGFLASLTADIVLLRLLYIIVNINVLLAVFNLVPIPPLDGSKILYALLPTSAQHIKAVLDRYGIILVFFFVFFLFKILSPIIKWVTELFFMFNVS